MQMNSQNDSQEQVAADLSENLSSKLSLSESQTNQLKDILVSYEDDVQGAVQSGKTDLKSEKATANSAIDDLLTDDQKTTWENTKSDFWATVDSKVNTTNVEQKSQQDTY